MSTLSLFDEDLDHDAKTAVIYARMEQCHKGIGWVWDGRLICKTVQTGDPEDETCHYELFGELIYRTRFRGWFHNGILVFMDRHQQVRGADEIPEQVYRHLMRRFKVKVGNFRFT